MSNTFKILDGLSAVPNQKQDLGLKQEQQPSNEPKIKKTVEAEQPAPKLALGNVLKNCFENNKPELDYFS